jgi:RNA polymerase primary sigma factor
MQALSEQSRIVRLPLNRVGSLNKVNKTFSELEQKFQREPTHEELAEVMETTPEEINKLASYKSRHVSMDAPLGSDNDAGTMLDVMADEGSSKPDVHLMNDSLKMEIQLSLRKLTVRESEVLSLYYGLSGGHSLSLHDIGEKFELTPERVRQIKEKATRKLRNTSRLDVLKSYLD